MSASIRKEGRNHTLTGRLLLLAGAAWLACAASQASTQDLMAPAAADNVVLQWDNAALEAVRRTIPGPTVVSRAIAVAHTAMFDAWAAYDATAVPTVLRRGWRRPAVERTDANKAQAVSFAAYRALVDLFPATKTVFDALMAQLGYDASDTSLDPTTAAGVGNAAAAAVLDVRHRDGSNQLGDLHAGAYTDYTGYQAVNTPTTVVDPNRWQPLSVLNPQGQFVTQVYTTPQWGNVTPFAMASGSALRPGPPARYPSSDYANQAADLVAISAGLTDVQKVTAEYFADGPNSEFPPGHWALFAQVVSRRDGHGLDDDAKMFFALGNALLDAGICAWDAKRAYDSVRPVTAIHFLYAGQLIQAWQPFRGTQTIRGEDWQPYQLSTVVTPPFPEYFSGHSVFSAAGAEVLKSFTGSDALGYSVTILKGTSRGEFGLVPAADVTLAFPTFSDAANAAGMSRRYGGIHFAQGDLTGRSLGRVIGAAVWAKAKTYFDGTAYRGEAVSTSRPRPFPRTLPR
ncbi:MAG TPA: vanadium-dependent haloperoxidase [Thermoanaerobaculia bacterium]|nr:vanadium-dependent haloperoxidase [Thermoanaerobaculia bacterium]